MKEEKPQARAAVEIIRRLESKEGIEVKHHEDLVRALCAALNSYEAGLASIVDDVLGRETSLVAAMSAFAARATAEGLSLDEDAAEDLTPELTAVLLESDAVEDVFLDDTELEKVVRAALLDYVPTIVANERARLSRKFVKPRTLTIEPKKEENLAGAGYAFPLFEGPLEDATVDDAGPCAYCSAPVEVRFKHACYTCFRAGKVLDFAKDTELGMVRLGDVAEGLTHGMPASAAPPGYEQAPSITHAAKGGEEWVRIRVDGDALAELLRTPQYDAWQGEQWLFCCKLPMVFVGALNEARLERMRDPQETREEFVAKLLRVDTRTAHARTLDILAARIGMYVFRCDTCSRHRAHWDAP